MQTQDKQQVSKRRIVERAQVGAVRYQLESVCCGKTACRRCGKGPGHGPYWYSYERSDGRVKRTYHGRDLPPDVAHTRLEATRVKRERQALAHELIEEVCEALLSLGKCLLAADERGLHELAPDELTADEVSLLEDQGSELEAAAETLAEAVRDTLRRVRQRVMQHDDLVQEAGYVLTTKVVEDETELEASDDFDK